jgi:hypothetical protein
MPKTSNGQAPTNHETVPIVGYGPTDSARFRLASSIVPSIFASRVVRILSLKKCADAMTHSSPR